MDQKTYFAVTALIFLIITLLHVARIFTGWEASIGGWIIPQWVSGIALAIFGFLTYSGFNLGKRGQ